VAAAATVRCGRVPRDRRRTVSSPTHALSKWIHRATGMQPQSTQIEANLPSRRTARSLKVSANKRRCPTNRNLRPEQGEDRGHAQHYATYQAPIPLAPPAGSLLCLRMSVKTAPNFRANATVPSLRLPLPSSEQPNRQSRFQVGKATSGSCMAFLSVERKQLIQ
jgi:hypothetical protein